MGRDGSTTRARAFLYVNANEMAWKVKLAERKMPDGEPTTGKTLDERYCASCHRADLSGTPPEFPSLSDVGKRISVDDIDSIVRSGSGRMPGPSGAAQRRPPRNRDLRDDRDVRRCSRRLRRRRST